MLEKEQGRTKKSITTLKDGLYIKRKTSLILVTKTLNFVEQPLVKVDAPLGLFRVVNGVIVPLNGVASVVIKNRPRLGSSIRVSLL